MKIENIRIEILKDTPFDKKGTILKLLDFRVKYGWICTTSTTNEELIKYLKTEHKILWSTSKPPEGKEYQLYIGEWFKVIELEDLEPLRFIYEGAYYTKGFDGMYHCWRSPEHFSLSFCGNEQPIAKITISEVRKMIEQARFKQHILYCTNNVNKKL
jgi:hypothetical protein